MLWNLKVWVAVSLDTVKKTIATIKWEFEKLGWDLEKTAWNKVFENLKKWSQETVVTISWLNKKLEELRSKLDISAIWSKEFFKLQKEIQNTEKQLDKATNKVWLFWQALKFWWWLLAWMWIIEAGKWIVTLWSAYEQVEVSFTTMLWSAEKAKKMLADLWQFAKETPFEIQGLRSTTKQLLAFWFAQEEIIPTLKGLWDVAAWLSVPVEQLAYAYWQVKVAWRLMWWELMQFTNAWVPLLNELAKMYWTNEMAIKKMVEQWKIWFADVEQAFKNMSSEGGRFADLMEKQSQTLAWRWWAFQDSIALFWEEIWRALLPALSSILWFFESLVSFVSPYILWLIKVVSTAMWQIKSWFVSTADVVQKNWDKVVKVVVWFWVALALLNRQHIANFIKSGIKSMLTALKSVYLAFYNLWKVTKATSTETNKNTISTAKNSVEKRRNAIASLQQENANRRVTGATLAQNKANNLTSFSFKQLWKSILWTVKNLLFMWLKFFAIAWIVLLVVTAVYKNWDSLKNKLKPVFEFIAKIWQKAPEIVAKAWNMLVEGLRLTIVTILWSAKKIVEALNYLPWVDIDTAWIDKAVKSVNDFSDSMKITWEDVEWVFNAIWWAVNDVSSDFQDLAWWTWDLTWWMNDLWQAMDDLWEKSEKAWWKTSEANKKIEKSIKDVEKAHKKLEEKVEKLNNLEEKRKDDLLEFNQQIIDSNHDVKESLEDIGIELQKNLENIEGWKQEKLAERYVEILEREKELEEEMLEIEKKNEDSEEKKAENLEKINKQIEIQKKRISEINDKTKESTKQSLKTKLEELEKTKELLQKWELSLENSKKMAKIEAERLKIAEEKKLIQENIDSEDRLNDAIWEADLWKTWKILYDAEKEKAKAEIEYEAEKKKLEDKLKINERFENINKEDRKVTIEDLNARMESEEVKQMDLENQRYFRKLAEQKIEHTNQKNEIIKLQNEIADETIKIQNKVNEILKNNISDIKDEYKDLINQIKTAILEQARLNSMRGFGKWYAEGWYTWDGGKYEEAWIVHKWEYVIPAHMLKAMPDLMPSLEAIRTWNVSTTQNYHTNKTIDVWNITVQDKVDLELFFDKMKWKM